MYLFIRNAFVYQGSKTSSPTNVFANYPVPDSFQTAEGMYVEADAYGVWRSLLTPAGFVLVMEGGQLYDEQALSKAVNETLDWKLEEVDTSSIATYILIEEEDTVMGPFDERPGNKVYWIQRVGEHHTPAENPVNPYYYRQIRLFDTCRAKDGKLFEV